MSDMKPLFDAVRRIKGEALTKADVDAINAALAGAQGDGSMHISTAGLALIKASEGLVLKAYLDAVGVLTIGYGSTGAHVKPGMVITEARAESLLLEDLARFEAAVRKLCPVTTQGQFDAMVSLSFNVGERAFEGSTLRRLHNAGNYVGAAAEFARWRFAGGKELPGLVKRRAAERALYEGRS